MKPTKVRCTIFSMTLPRFSFGSTMHSNRRTYASAVAVAALCSVFSSLHAQHHPAGHVGPYVNPALIPPPSSTGHAVDRITTSFGTTPSDIGASRTACTFSHMAFDDPIVVPGQPGRSHLHTFFGNTDVSGHSTAASIASSGRGTCLGGTANRSAYWIPSVIDTRDGRPMPPGEIVFIYYKTGYKGVQAENVRPFPVGLRMIAGDARSTTPPALYQERHEFYCSDVGHNVSYNNGTSIPTCRAGDRLNAALTFPQCWDGQRLDSPDHKSHMAYAENGCPSSHPIPFVEVSFQIHWLVPSTGDTSTWRLSSDVANTAVPAGYSMHGDWFNGWKPDIVDTWVRHCINARRDCGVGELGDGRRLY
jgi:Domain of unknown function (DUF1996)